MSQQYLLLMYILFQVLLVSDKVSSQEGFDRHSTDVSGNERSSIFFYQRPEFPRDCFEALNQCSSSSSDGVYLIKPDGYPEPFEVYCSNDLDGGGWTVLHRRHDGSINFNRTWNDYKNGFGFLSQEFWLGNEKISHITNQKQYKLRVDIVMLAGLSYALTFDAFRVSDHYGNYEMVSTGRYNGTAGIDIQGCPTNEVVSSCKCEGTCADPNCTTTCNNTPTCVCPDGFLIDGDDCVPREDCGCFLQEADGGLGRAIKEGDEYVNPFCTMRCSCTDDQIRCDDTYRCSSDAVCEDRAGSSQCYCKEGFTGNGVQCVRSTSQDCGDFIGDTSDSIQLIQPAGWLEPFQVTCDAQDGGGWLVFQRRVNSSVSFYRYWNDYKEGFGSVDGNFWLGNDKLAAIISQREYELRIDFVSKTGRRYFAKYSSFGVGNEGTNYRLSVGGYDSSSTAGGDSMAYHNGKPFTTRDRDNDDFVHNWASHGTTSQSAWWYGDTYNSDLNARYSGVTYTIYWYYFPEGGNNNIQATEMKIRPRF